VSRTWKSPALLYVCVPETVPPVGTPGEPWVTTRAPAVGGVWSPQSIVAVKGSTVPAVLLGKPGAVDVASVRERRGLATAVRPVAAVTLGATFDTEAEAVREPEAPALSVTVTVMV